MITVHWHWCQNQTQHAQEYIWMEALLMIQKHLNPYKTQWMLWNRIALSISWSVKRMRRCCQFLCDDDKAVQIKSKLQISWLIYFSRIDACMVGTSDRWTLRKLDDFTEAFCSHHTSQTDNSRSVDTDWLEQSIALTVLKLLEWQFFFRLYSNSTGGVIIEIIQPYPMIKSN